MRINLITRVLRSQRGLRYRYGEFRGLLQPGRYWFFSRLWSRERDHVGIVDTLLTRFDASRLDVMLENAGLRAELEVVDLPDSERAVVWRQDRVWAVLGPGRHAFWRSPYRLRIERFNIADFWLNLPAADLEAVAALPGVSRWLSAIDVAEHERALLLRNGKLVETLGPGRYLYWSGAGKVAIRPVDQRDQQADVAGQEIMTRDKVTLRLNALLQYRVIDAERAATSVADYSQALYREAQLALRAAVGARSLDDLLADKDAIGGEVRAALAERAQAIGVEVRSVGVKDIILPGDMKAILNRVIEAEKQAQANLIQRREETAAARSQANTAKLLQDNPQLARLRELELLQEILRGSNATFVFGNADVLEQMRGLTTTARPRA